MKKLVGLLVVLAVGPLPGVASAAPDPLTCEGYGHDRQFVDAQSWWLQTPLQQGEDFGHVHVGTCIPEREEMGRSRFQLDVRIIMHDNPGLFQRVTLVTRSGAGNPVTQTHNYSIQGLSCPEGTCERWTRLTVKPSMFSRSGLEEVRLRTLVREPNGDEMRASLNFQTYIRNGRPEQDVTAASERPWLRGKGWYTDAGYCEAALRSVPLPDDPIFAPWTPDVTFLDHSTGENSGDRPVTHHTARLDPDFHAGNEGIVLKDGPDEYEGPLEVNAEPGPHKLFLRSDCDDPRGSTNSGVLVVPFTTYQPPEIVP
jgi:hypothetical protein